MRTTQPLLAVVLVAVLVAGCVADADIPAPHQSGTPDSATVTVSTQIRPSRQVFYIEGAIPQVHLLDSDGIQVRGETGDHGTRFTFSDLAPGTYRIEAALRPCDGNCGYLDSPVDGCSYTHVIGDDLAVHVAFVMGKPCRVTTS